MSTVPKLYFSRLVTFNTTSSIINSWILWTLQESPSLHNHNNSLDLVWWRSRLFSTCLDTNGTQVFLWTYLFFLETRHQFGVLGDLSWLKFYLKPSERHFPAERTDDSLSICTGHRPFRRPGLIPRQSLLSFHPLIVLFGYFRHHFHSCRNVVYSHEDCKKSTSCQAECS